MRSSLVKVPRDEADNHHAEGTQPEDDTESASERADDSTLEAMQPRQFQSPEGTTLELNSLQRDWQADLTDRAQIAGERGVQTKSSDDEVQEDVQEDEYQDDDENEYEKEPIIGHMVIRDKDLEGIDDRDQDEARQATSEEDGEDSVDEKVNKSVRQQYGSTSNSENEIESLISDSCPKTKNEADIVSAWKSVTCPGEPITPSDYMWRDASAAIDAHSHLDRRPGTICYRRPLIGAETSWAVQPAESRRLFINCSLRHGVFVSKDTWKSAILDAWIALLIEVPELMTHVVNSGAPGGYLLYAPVSSDPEKIMNWIRSDAENSMATNFRDYRPEGRQLRDVLLSQIGLQGRTSNMFLYSWGTLRSRYDNSILTTDIILFLDHVITDGIGARIILGKLLSHLTTYIGQYPSKPLPRNAEEPWKNLSPPWVCTMNEDQKTSAADHENKAKCYLKIITKDIPFNPGFTVLQRETITEIQKTINTHFTAAESRGLLKAVKTKLGATATITQLGHAAMVIAMLRSAILVNTERNSWAFKGLVSPCWLNGRRYLQRGPNSEESFMQNCLTFSPIIFPNYNDLILKTDSPDDWVINRLILAYEHAARSYLALRYDTVFESPLPGSIKMFEQLAFPKLEIFNPQRDSEPPTEQYQRPIPIPEFVESVKREVASEERAVADPYFLSDGIMENYINHHYPFIKIQETDAEASQTTTRPPIIEVETLTFRAHAGENIIVRMSTWREQINLTAEYRSDKYDAEEKNVETPRKTYCNEELLSLARPSAHIFPEEHIPPYMIKNKLSEPSTTPRLMTALALNDMGMVAGQVVARLIEDLLEDPRHMRSRIVLPLVGLSTDTTPTQKYSNLKNSSLNPINEGVDTEGTLYPPGPASSTHENASKDMSNEEQNVHETLHLSYPSLSQASSRKPFGSETVGSSPTSPRRKHAILPGPPSESTPTNLASPGSSRPDHSALANLSYRPHGTKNPPPTPSSVIIRRQVSLEEVEARRKPLLTALKRRGSSSLANELILKHRDEITPIVRSQQLLTESQQHARQRDAHIERVSSKLALSLAMFQQRKDHNIGASQEDLSKQLASGLQLWMDRLDNKTPLGYYQVPLIDEINHFSELCDELPWDDEGWEQNLPRFHLLNEIFESFEGIWQATTKEKDSKGVPRSMQREEETGRIDDDLLHHAMRDSLKRSGTDLNNDAQAESYGRTQRVAKKRKLSKQEN